MSSLSCFFQENVENVENIKYVASNRIKDEKGNPVEWLLRPISTEEIEKIRKQATRQTFVKRNQVKEETDVNKMNILMCTASVIYPDLLNTELQDNYKVKTPEDLLRKILNIPGEYFGLLEKVTELNKFDLEESKEEIKN